MEVSNKRGAVRAKILELLAARKAGGTICPSEVARGLFPEPDWRNEMDLVRSVAEEMANQGRIEICQGGRPVEPGQYRGPIRLRQSC